MHILSLDHDLGTDEKGNMRRIGYNLVKYICEKGIRPENRIYIKCRGKGKHVSNLTGRTKKRVH
ncbi:cyclic-phosphate processing receiver domain-containing protein [Aeribacillus sp. FSL K6-1121]|uniref:cyclic-phosphate processing receiver domain-containing protein n=1 Tax=unclassified Aeribacillus TaxID=2640495 RepID=UPI0030CF2E0D